MIALEGRDADEESDASIDNFEEYYTEYTNGYTSSDGSRYSADIYDELGSDYDGYEARDVHF